MAFKGMLVKLAGVLLLVICGTKTDVDGAPTDKMDMSSTTNYTNDYTANYTADELSRTKRGFGVSGFSSIGNLTISIGTDFPFNYTTDELSRTKRGLDWRSLIAVVTCGHAGRDAHTLVKSLRDELKDVSTSVDWLVWATDAKNGWSYHRSGSWVHEEKQDLCGFDVHVFKRANELSCSTSIKSDAHKLQGDAARESRSYAGAKDIIKGRDHQYNIETDLVITYEFGSYASYIDKDCTSFHSGVNGVLFWKINYNIASFMVGSRT